MDFDLSPFEPHPLVRGGNAQTIIGTWLPVPPQPVGAALDFVPTTEGDSLALISNQPGVDHLGSPGTIAPRQVLLLHGLAGCHASSYMIRTTSRLLEAGFGVFRMEARGSGMGRQTARYHHHAGRSEDVDAAVRFILRSHPAVRLTVVGFSLGGNVALNWLGDHDVPPNVDSAIAVAPPIDLANCSRNLLRGFSRFYDRYFARMMMQRVHQRRESRPDMADFRFRSPPIKLSEFDSVFTAPAGGFDNLNDYYTKCSSIVRLPNIATPTLILVDEQDPVIPIGLFDRLDHSPMIRIERTRGGGHLGYIGKNGIDPDRYWLSWRIKQVVENIETMKQGRKEQLLVVG